jgi:hypothetical protein
MHQLFLNFATVTELAAAAALLAGVKVSCAAPETLKDAVAPPPPPAAGKDKPKAIPPAETQKAADTQPSPVQTAAPFKPEDITKVVMKFVPNHEHKTAVLALLGTFKQADGSPVTKGRELQDSDRAEAYKQIVALAKTFDLKLD